MSELTSVGANVSLSLVSHTNAGKTTLARTLLARDVGEVRDAPHVTEFAEDHALVTTPEGDALTLWDTPGFGDSVRLVKRLRTSGNPVGWFLSEVWDRFRDRAFYASQQAMKNVRERADVVLYLVNASETPESAGYIESEMELLDWMGKPVIVLLNQLGAPRDGALEDAELQRWRESLSRFEQVKSLMPLDAFARCWVQEFHLLGRVQAALPGDKRAAMSRLLEAWRLRRLATFDASVDELAQSLARIASMREAMPEAAGMRGTLRQIGAAMGGLWKQATSSGDDAQVKSADAALAVLPPEAQAAQRALAARADDEVRSSLGRLIVLHGLDGTAQSELNERIGQHFDMQLHLDERKAAVLGGAVSGALGGLAADVGSAGLTLGGGMIAGAVLGALAAAGAARGVNIMRGRQSSSLAWSAAAMDAMVEAALLRYLAVAHFGRGRGQWQQGEAPPHWRAVVREALAPQRGAWAALWQRSAQARQASLLEAAAAKGNANAAGAGSEDGSGNGHAVGSGAGAGNNISNGIDGSNGNNASSGNSSNNGTTAGNGATPGGAKGAGQGGGSREPQAVSAAALQPLLRQAAADVLARLYPASAAVLGHHAAPGAVTAHAAMSAHTAAAQRA